MAHKISTLEQIVEAHLAALGRSDATTGWAFDFEHATSAADLQVLLATAPTAIAAALALGRLWGTREAEYAGGLVAHLDAQHDREGPRH
jgi:hypothetical protein